MIYNIAILVDVASAVGHAFRWLIARLATLVYNLIVVMYDLFEYLARAEIITNDFVQEIYKKVGFLLGLFMLFKLVFSAIQSLIDPNKITDKKNGYAQILMRSVISIVLLGVTPTIFTEAFKLQNLLIGSSNNSDNVIYKLIIGNADTGSDSFGRVIATEAYFAFYRDDDYPFLANNQDTSNNDSQFYETKVDGIKQEIRRGYENFDYAQLYLNYTSNGVYVIEYNELLSIAFGIGILWMLFMYCIQVAVRVFQLAYLQIIAPIPILSYISDPSGAFQRWLKQCVSTFLDLFMRLAVIYFMIYFANHIILLFNDNDSVLSSSTGLSPNNSVMWSLLEIFLILGLLIFAKKVPELIKDLFPNMGSGAGKFSFSLKSPKELKQVATFGVGTAAGAVGGFATGIRHGEGFKGKIAGAFTGFGRGALGGMRIKGNPFKNAAKGMANQRAAAQRAYEKHHDGSTFFGRKAPVHAERVAAEIDRELQAYKDYDTYASIVDKEVEKDSTVQSIMAEKERLLKTGTITVRDSTGKLITRKVVAKDIESIDRRIKIAKKAAIETNVDKFKRGDTTANQTLVNAIIGASQIQSKGVSNGYAGFDTASMDINTQTASDIASRFDENKKKSKTETGNINNPGGSRHEEYTRAKANAKYKKK